MLALCRAEQPGLLWEGVTGRFVVPYVASEVSYAVAAHPVLGNVWLGAQALVAVWVKA